MSPTTPSSSFTESSFTTSEDPKRKQRLKAEKVAADRLHLQDLQSREAFLLLCPKPKLIRNLRYEPESSLGDISCSRILELTPEESAIDSKMRNLK